MAPASTIPWIELAADISGVCRVAGTLLITSKPTQRLRMKMVRSVSRAVDIGGTSSGIGRGGRGIDRGGLGIGRGGRGIDGGGRGIGRGGRGFGRGGRGFGRGGIGEG